MDSGLRGGTMLPHRTNVIPDMAAQSKKRSTRRSRGELWQHDLKTLDTGLVEDLLERALREAYNKYYTSLHYGTWDRMLTLIPYKNKYW